LTSFSARRFGKSDFTEGAVRVTAQAWWPGAIKAGQTVGDIIDVTDLFTTFARIGGVTQYLPTGSSTGRTAAFAAFQHFFPLRFFDSVAWSFAAFGFERLAPAGKAVEPRHIDRVAKMHSHLTRELAVSFANIVLAHVTREYPGKMDHVLTGPSDVQNPRALHPAFYGSYDWHSCVHGFWLLAKILRLFPDLPRGPDIHALFDKQLSAENIAGELGYLASRCRTISSVRTGGRGS
jgi:Protein of unknown function (DUF2891)